MPIPSRHSACWRAHVAARGGAGLPWVLSPRLLSTVDGVLALVAQPADDAHLQARAPALLEPQPHEPARELASQLSPWLSHSHRPVHSEAGVPKPRGLLAGHGALAPRRHAPPRLPRPAGAEPRPIAGAAARVVMIQSAGGGALERFFCLPCEPTATDNPRPTIWADTTRKLLSPPHRKTLEMKAPSWRPPSRRAPSFYTAP